jgi:hypothetical protein
LLPLLLLRVFELLSELLPEEDGFFTAFGDDVFDPVFLWGRLTVVSPVFVFAIVGRGLRGDLVLESSSLPDDNTGCRPVTAVPPRRPVFFPESLAISVSLPPPDPRRVLPGLRRAITVPRLSKSRRLICLVGPTA